MSITSQSELEDYARHLRIPLRAVFSKDTPPSHLRDGGYIINLEDQQDSHGRPLPGTHWTAFWVHHNQGVYFDPFGLTPPAQVDRMLDGLDDAWYSDMEVQDVNRGYCGIYCLAFLHFMNQHPQFNLEERLDRFLLLWDRDTSKNEKRLLHLIRLPKTNAGL
jgi:hypothetical protein